jgi:hypothetical protein
MRGLGRWVWLRVGLIGLGWVRVRVRVRLVVVVVVVVVVVRRMVWARLGRGRGWRSRRLPGGLAQSDG